MQASTQTPASPCSARAQHHDRDSNAEYDVLLLRRFPRPVAPANGVGRDPVPAHRGSAEWQPPWQSCFHTVGASHRGIEETRPPRPLLDPVVTPYAIESRHATPADRHPRHRPDRVPARAVRVDDPRQPRRRRDQGRGGGVGRPGAVRVVQPRGRAQQLLRGAQPRQALDRARPEAAARARHLPPPRRAQRRAAAQLPHRRGRAARARLRGRLGRQPAHRLRAGVGVGAGGRRAGRRGIRLCRAGAQRLRQHQRRARRPSPAVRRRHRRPERRAARVHRRARRHRRARDDRPRREVRHVAARQHAGAAVVRHRQLPVHGPAARALLQRRRASVLARVSRRRRRLVHGRHAARRRLARDVRRHRPAGDRRTTRASTRTASACSRTRRR